MKYINNGSEPLQHKVYQRATPRKSQSYNIYKPKVSRHPDITKDPAIVSEIRTQT